MTMNILFGSLIGLTLGQYRERFYEKPPASIYSSNEVHQGNLCGDVTHYVLTGQPQLLKSPYYPASFSPQTQCMWTIRSEDPRARLKLTFDDWAMPTSGDGCMAMYFQIIDGTGIDEDTGIAGSTASVKLCGKNPGYIVTNTNQASIQLHADEAGASATQRFRIVLTKTYERPRMLAYDGHAVTDGRGQSSKSAKVPVASRPVGPGAIGRVNSPVGRNVGPAALSPVHRGPGVSGVRAGMGNSNSATFHGASYGFPNRPAVNDPIHRSSFDSSSSTHHVGPELRPDYDEDISVEKEEISRIGIAFIYIAVILALIVLAIVIRKRVQRDTDKEVENKPPDSGEAGGSKTNGL